MYNLRMWPRAAQHNLAGRGLETHASCSVFFAKYHSMDGACGTTGDRSGVHRVLVGNPEERRALGRPSRRWDNNIKRNQQVGQGGTDWTDLSADRDTGKALVNAVMHLRVP
jgi:hypothetical protein